MRYPRLVREAKTDVRVLIEANDINEFGEKECVVEGMFKGNVQDKAMVRYTTEKQLVQVSGNVLFDGDICPKMPVISRGKVTFFGQTREIESVEKARNPDGTVNFTAVYLK